MDGGDTPSRGHERARIPCRMNYVGSDCPCEAGQPGLLRRQPQRPLARRRGARRDPPPGIGDVECRYGLWPEAEDEFVLVVNGSNARDQSPEIGLRASDLSRYQKETIDHDAHG